MRRVHEKMLATFEALRCLEFTPDEIFAGWSNGPLMVLRAQGKEFIIDYKGVDTDLTLEEFQQGWVEAGNAWNETMTNEERDRIYHDHMNIASFVSLMTALHNKGFRQKNGRPLHEMPAPDPTATVAQA